MKNEIVKINAADYGLQEPKANELTVGLDITLKERVSLIDEFDTLSKLEINKENIPKFKELRLRIVKNRTLGISKWHKDAKNYFLKGGQFVDAVKNQEIAINELMEEKLMDAEKHYENLERERIAELQEKRQTALFKYEPEMSIPNLGEMTDDVWTNYIAGVKLQSEAKIEAAKKVERDRIEAEKKIEAERIEKEKADKLERERIRKENEQLRKEAKERERLAKIETEKLEAIKAKLLEKQEAEDKARQEAEEKLQIELSKGDAAKIIDLVIDLKALKGKYTFKSKVNNKMYEDVGNLIDKVINHINK